MFITLWVFCVCVCVNLCTSCMHDAHRVQKKMLDPPETRLVDGYVPPSRCWESNLGPLGEGPALLYLCVCRGPFCQPFLNAFSSSDSGLRAVRCSQVGHVVRQAFSPLCSTLSSSRAAAPSEVSESNSPSIWLLPSSQELSGMKWSSLSLTHRLKLQSRRLTLLSRRLQGGVISSCRHTTHTVSMHVCCWTPPCHSSLVYTPQLCSSSRLQPPGFLLQHPSRGSLVPGREKRKGFPSGEEVPSSAKRLSLESWIRSFFHVDRLPS